MLSWLNLFWKSLSLERKQWEKENNWRPYTLNIRLTRVHIVLAHATFAKEKVFIITIGVLLLKNFFDSKYKKKISPLFVYGGRSTPDRTRQILADKNIDGLILGSKCVKY